MRKNIKITILVILLLIVLFKTSDGVIEAFKGKGNKGGKGRRGRRTSHAWGGWPTSYWGGYNMYYPQYSYYPLTSLSQYSYYPQSYYNYPYYY